MTWEEAISFWEKYTRGPRTIAAERAVAKEMKGVLSDTNARQNAVLLSYARQVQPCIWAGPSRKICPGCVGEILGLWDCESDAPTCPCLTLCQIEAGEDRLLAAWMDVVFQVGRKTLEAVPDPLKIRRMSCR